MLSGQVHPDFADVAATLSRQLGKRPGGSAVCVYHRGAPVVDVWGGNARPDAEWQQDTTAHSFSTTKGVMSTLVHRLVDQGRARYEDPVADHWPSFAARGKSNITIAHALSHEAGLHRVAELVGTPEELLDWHFMKRQIADAEPAFPAGERNAYHALSYGWLIGGLIEGITGEPLEDVLDRELRQPLELDGAYIGMPTAALARRALLTNPRITGTTPKTEAQARWFGRLEAGLATLGINLEEGRQAMFAFGEDFDWNDEAVVRAQIPAANGQFTARSLARMYAMIAEGGALDGVRLLAPATVRAMGEVRSKRRDAVIQLPMHWRLGYHRTFAGRAPLAFGHYGYGGSGALCDPSRRLAVAMVTNAGRGTPMGDSRMVMIARSAINAADRLG